MARKSKAIYLAHPFNSRKEIRSWEKKILKEYPEIKFINPFYNKKSIEKFNLNDVSGEEYYKKLGKDFFYQIVENDLDLIGSSDMVLAIVNRSLSYGTIMEMVYAHLHCKELFIICTNGHYNHPWFRYHATKIFKSFEEFEIWLKKHSSQKIVVKE